MDLPSGGAGSRPGGVRLAYHGVLLLDVPEFPRSALGVLRQPLEDGRVTIVRASQSVTFPSRFMLAAAMNPCTCREGSCSEHEARAINSSGRRFADRQSRREKPKGTTVIKPKRKGASRSLPA